MAYEILIQMLDCIEVVHDKGYIHRDIKPSNFVLCQEEKRVFIVDFGLSKLHLNKKGLAVPARKTADFRGTLVYASMNAHNKIDLSRRDDLYSFFFIVLELLNEAMPWRTGTDDKEKIANRKNDCLVNPEKELLINNVNKKEILQILYHIKSLQYGDRPNYDFIRNILKGLLNNELRSSQQETTVSPINDNLLDGNFKDMLSQIQGHQNYMTLLTKFLEINQNLLCLKKEINDNIYLAALGMLQEQFNQGNNMLKKKRVRNNNDIENNLETDTTTRKDTQDSRNNNNQSDLLSQMYCLEAYTKYFTQIQQEYLNRYIQTYCWK